MSKSKRKADRTAATSRSPAAPKTAPVPSRRPRRRRPWRLIVLVAAVLLGGGLAVSRFIDLGAWRGPEIPNPDTSSMQAPVARVIRAARQAVVEQPSSAQAWGKLGTACDAHHLYDEALISYRRAHELEPKNFVWAYLLATLQDIRGAGTDEIESRFQKAIQLNSVYPPAPYRYGDALTRLGKPAEAAAAYRRAIELDPNFALAHRSLGQVLISLNDPATAVRHLERAAELEPNDSIVFTTLARGYTMLGDRPRADAAAVKSTGRPQFLSVPDPVRFDVEALNVSPTACIKRYQGAMHSGAYAQAIPDLKLLEEMFPESATYQLHLGTCYLYTGQSELAQSHFKKAVALDDDHPEAYFHLAFLAQQENRFDEAVEHYRRVVALDPGKRDTHAKLALALGMAGDLDGAILEFERASGMGPPDAEILHNWGTVLMRKGSHQEAVARFRAALALAPNNTGTLYNLGYTLEQLGQKAEAVATYRRAVKIEPQGLAAQRLAQLGG